jgi:predicted amidohydrolase
MPRNRKDYTLRSSVNEPVSIEDYRAVPWRQTYTDTTVDFRRWLYIGRPELADDGSSLSVNNGETKPLVHAGRDGMVDALRNAVWHIPSVEAITKLSYCSKGITNWLEYLDCRDFSGQAVYELADIDKEVVQGFIHWLKFTKEVDTETGRLSYQTANPSLTSGPYFQP